MARFLVRRLAGAVLLLVITSMVTFAIFFIVPRLAGQTVDQLAAQYVGKDPSQAEIEATKEKLGLDKPIIVQYGQFIKGIVAGREFSFGPDTEYCPPPCFGYSFKTQRPVWPDLVDRVPVTFSLAIGAAVIWLITGVSIGVLSALKKGTIFDRFAMVIALAGVSLPIFFTGLLSLALFRPTGVNYVPFTSDPLGWASNLLLPWITLAFLYAALYARLTRAGMLETMTEDYIRTARAKGLRERKVVTRHALRATLTPILTIFGLDIGLLLGGAVLTESTFSLPGIGRYAIDAINNQDLPQVLGVTMLAAFFVVVASLVVDLLYAVADPRVRL
ncbi:ABC transporter permease [Catelliglobosispora koreensis]|uniref:ABC transporter permease n=1 Tax=Catelliglobosispora koreensis TaxID=129052 RepID=UPI000371E29B|nr:ABC transporter permease [Catelliglobosispora koreensis]